MVEKTLCNLLEMGSSVLLPLAKVLIKSRNENILIQRVEMVSVNNYEKIMKK